MAAAYPTDDDGDEADKPGENAPMFGLLANAVTRVIHNQIACVGGWLKQIKEDKKLVISAAGAAQHGADWIRGERGVVG